MEPISIDLVLDCIFQKLEEKKELNDEILKELATIFCTTKSAQILAHALNIIDHKMVTKLVGKISKRSLFIVKSSQHNNLTSPNSKSSTAKPSRWNNVQAHCCYSDTFCTCEAFRYSVISSSGNQTMGPSVQSQQLLFCKHLLAVRISKALQNFKTEEIEDAELSQYILHKI